MTEDVVVTAAEIARLAGVGRAAVSNWRRRHENFPQPAGGTDVSPTFRLSEVESWLNEQGKLPEISARDRAWQQLEAARGDLRAADVLFSIAKFLRDEHADVPRLLRDAVRELIEETDPESAFEQLVERFVATNVRQLSVTPPELARLLVELAAPARGTALDPACGTGSILLAASRAGLRPLGQELDDSLAKLASTRLAFRTADADIRTGDSLRADGFDEGVADVVLCNPPFNRRDWGHDELAYDSRWKYGLPPRGESELAWVQHCLSRVKPGGPVVLLMPPAVAFRRAGRRIRAELVRRGALRAVIALPAGAAPPHGIALSIWVLRRPRAEEPATEVRFVDTSTVGTLDWDAIRARVFGEEGRVVPAIDLLDEEVDLSPARHLQPSGRSSDASHVSETRGRLVSLLSSLAGSVPDVEIAADDHAPQAMTTAGDLAKSGALAIHQPKTEGLSPLPGDVVVSAVDHRLVPRVVTAAGEALGPREHLLRPDPDVLDPWFLAGFLRSSGNLSLATAQRLDIRRVVLPRVPLERQRRYGAAFRALRQLEHTLRAAAELGDDFTQAVTDGLAAGNDVVAQEDCTAGDTVRGTR